MGESLGNVLSYLNPFHENFLLRGVLEALQFINPFSDKFFGYKIIDGIVAGIEFLFKPQGDTFSNLYNKLNEKFPFINQIKTLAHSLLGFEDYGTTTPSFEITYMGTKAKIIDFSPFLSYRVWLHGIILAISWFSFIKKLYNRMPKVVGGIS